MNSLRSVAPPLHSNFALKNTSYGLTKPRYSASIIPSSLGMNLIVRTVRAPLNGYLGINLLCLVMERIFDYIVNNITVFAQ